MSGRLIQFPLRDGDAFKRGEVLARFFCDDKESTLARAKAVLDGKRAVEVTKQRLRALGTSSIVEYQVAQADAEQAAADVKTAQTLVDACTVVAPFSGRVSSVQTQNYQYLQTGAPLLGIVGDSGLIIEMIVPSQWLEWLKPGTPFHIAIDETGQTWPASITRLSGKVDAVSRSIKVYGRIDKTATGLLPGMSGRAIFAPPAGASSAVHP